jgi:hypothetical protein
MKKYNKKKKKSQLTARSYNYMKYTRKEEGNAYFITQDNTVARPAYGIILLARRECGL